MPAPIVSVILLVWNNHEHLRACLDALQAQTVRDFEIILVDNGSAETDALNVICQAYPTLRIAARRLETNTGFAAGNNAGARLAQGTWLALLNVDAFPQPDWLETLLRAADEHPQAGAFTSRQLQFHAPHLLDGAGDSYHVTGLAWRRFYNRSVQEYGSQGGEVFSACPAAAMYRREEFMRAGGFDEDYFAYFEDVDLGFRIRLGGGKCLYVPEAVVYHVGSASTGRRSDFSVYHGYRNLIWTFVKNMPPPLFWLFLPLHIAALSFFIAYLTLRGQGRAVWRAVFDALRGLPSVFKKRRNIQRSRNVKLGELLKLMSTGLFEPYLEFIERNKR